MDPSGTLLSLGLLEFLKEECQLNAVEPQSSLRMLLIQPTKIHKNRRKHVSCSVRELEGFRENSNLAKVTMTCCFSTS